MYTKPENYSKLIKNKSECVDNCEKDPIFNFEYKGICYEYENNPIIYTIIYTNELTQKINYINKTENISVYESIVKNILDNYKKMDELNGNILETKIKDVLFTLMTTDNQKNNLYNNKSSINLGKCENIIKFVYNISYNDSLYIFKIEKKEELMKISLSY